jgi:hypothetical protein
MTWSIGTSGGTGNTDTVLLQAKNDSTYGSPQIQSYKVFKETQMTLIPIPTLDSSSTIGLDILGTVRNISINGYCTGTSAQLSEFIGDLEDKVYGKQFTNTNKGNTLTVELAKTGVTTYNVIVKSFTYEYSSGVPNRIEYSLDMVQVASS